MRVAGYILCCMLAGSQPASQPTSQPLSTSAVGAANVGQPWGSVQGVVQFRGNPTHTWYGVGPLPTRPRVLWRFPRQTKMCAQSPIGDQPKEWCGTGWTGQPVVRERADGVTELIFGAFDRKVHFLDAATGQRTRPDFATRDIIKGTVSIDPDGYPLIYFGSRDNKLRIVALDRERPTELWALDAYAVKGLYNDDWDGNPTVIDDLLIEGGENGYLFVVALNRRYDSAGLVSVAPEIKLAYPAWNDALLHRLHDLNISIESSVAVFGNRIYASNSGGRVFGLDLAAARQGQALVVFDYWAGDDVDASIVIDQQGMLYIGVEEERRLPAARGLGQLIKLDPARSGDPVVWRLRIPGLPGDPRGGGIWSTPALHRGVLYATSQSGQLLAIDRDSGQVLWRQFLGSHLWSSPVVVDDTLLVATRRGILYFYDVTDARLRVPLGHTLVGRGGCIESTPLVYRGRIYVGSWDGYLYALGDPASDR